MTDGSSTLECALAYIAAGVHVNPVRVTRKADGKKDVRPVGLWRQTSSASAADVHAWWGEGGKCPDAGILIDCGKSRLVVVDLDGEQGIRNWRDLFGDAPIPTPLWIVDTAGGGQHWYYRAHPDHVIGNDQDGKVGVSIDIRGLGGFVIAPPTEDGRGGWTARSEPQWATPTATLVPDVVIERMRRPSPATAPAPVPTPEGEPLADNVERTFTEADATRWVKDAGDRLAQPRTSGWNGAINDFAMTCAHFPWLIDRDLCARVMIRKVKPITGWTAPDHEDIATIDSAYKATEAGRSWVGVRAEAAGGQGGEVGQEVAGGGFELLPSPAEPLAVAKVLAAGRRDLAWWQGDFYRWVGTHWEKWEEAAVRRWLYDVTGEACWMKPDGKGGADRVRWAPGKGKIANLIEALGEGHLSRFGQEDRCMAFVNGVLDPLTGQFVEHEPARFNLSSLPFAYDPDARCPEWEAFLRSSLPGDEKAHAFLAEWFGYVLSGRTDLQKIGALIGPTRCGKGTAARTLRALAGEQNCCAPTLAKLSAPFGTETMIGKSLAVMGDVRWTSKHVVEAVPVLLGISGEDADDVHRKHQKAWSGRLPTRIMLMSNDAPAFTDASGALAGRMVYVAFETSFLGREDYGLEGRLTAELPGILNWALEGLARLNAQGGRFTQSERSLVLKGEVDRDSSPVAAWVDDRCALDEGAEFYLESLFRSYRDWLTAENAGFSPSLARFSRDLQSAFRAQGVTVARKDMGKAGKHRIVRGIRPLAGSTITDPDGLFDNAE